MINLLKYIKILKDFTDGAHTFYTGGIQTA